jgi:hypothetical protein
LSLCSECEFLLYEFESILDDLKENFNRNPSKRYKSLIKSALLHLEKTHKLITPGHYANIYMSIGIALSLPFGVLVSFLGLPFGIGLGLLVGSIFDKKAKDAGLTI